MSFTVDTQQVHGAGADIQRIAADIESSVTAMAGRLHALEGSWQGSASASFQACVTEWHSLQSRVREDLAAIGQATASAATSYQSTEDNVRTMFAR